MNEPLEIAVFATDENGNDVPDPAETRDLAEYLRESGFDVRIVEQKH